MVIAVTEIGGSEFRSRGQVQEAKLDRLLVFNPGEPHSGRMGSSPRWRYRSLYVDAQALADIARATGLETAPYFTQNVFADRDLIAAFHHLHQVCETDSDPFLSKERLATCFGQLYKRYGDNAGRVPTSPRDRRTLKIVLDLVQDRFRERLTLDDLCGVVALNHFQLIGLFNRTLGISPYAYITQVRLQQAICRLKVGLPTAETAVAAGFYDQSAFNNHFKRAYGITPLQYARAVAGT